MFSMYSVMNANKPQSPVELVLPMDTGGEGGQQLTDSNK